MHYLEHSVSTYDYSTPTLHPSSRIGSGQRSGLECSVACVLNVVLCRCAGTNPCSTAAFWREHHYDCETSDYFSFLHPLTGPPQNSLDQVLQLLHAEACKHFPQAKYAQRFSRTADNR